MTRILLFLIMGCLTPANAHLDIDLGINLEQVYNRGFPAGMGSGNYFKIGKHRFIITAAHVVNGTDEVLIMEKGSSSTGATVIYLDNDADIAILVPHQRLKYTKATSFRRDINNQMGEKVYHCGHPSGQGWHMSEGLLTGTNSNVLMINTFAWPGSSGSVVFDESGRVIGVLSAILVDGPFGIPDMVEHIVLAANIKMLDHQELKGLLGNGE